MMMKKKMMMMRRRRKRGEGGEIEPDSGDMYCTTVVFVRAIRTVLVTITHHSFIPELTVNSCVMSYCRFMFSLFLSPSLPVCVKMDVSHVTTPAVWPAVIGQPGPPGHHVTAPVGLDYSSAIGGFTSPASHQQ